MELAGILPSAVVIVVVATTVLSGPLGPVDLTTDPTTCAENVFPEQRNATVDPRTVPERATLTRSDFVADVWRLTVPAATVNVSDVSGRPTVSYRLQVPELGRTVGTRVVLSHCTSGRVPLRIDEATLPPEAVEEEQYDATAFVVYRGTENGTKVERTLVTRNATVEVAE